MWSRPSHGCCPRGSSSSSSSSTTVPRYTDARSVGHYIILTVGRGFNRIIYRTTSAGLAKELVSSSGFTIGLIGGTARLCLGDERPFESGDILGHGRDLSSAWAPPRGLSSSSSSGSLVIVTSILSVTVMGGRFLLTILRAHDRVWCGDGPRGGCAVHWGHAGRRVSDALRLRDSGGGRVDCGKRRRGVQAPDGCLSAPGLASRLFFAPYFRGFRSGPAEALEERRTIPTVAGDEHRDVSLLPRARRVTYHSSGTGWPVVELSLSSKALKKYMDAKTSRMTMVR